MRNTQTLVTLNSEMFEAEKQVDRKTKKEEEKHAKKERPDNRRTETDGTCVCEGGKMIKNIEKFPPIGDECGG